jgi:hypothetical protein
MKHPKIQVSGPFHPEDHIWQVHLLRRSSGLGILTQNRRSEKGIRSRIKVKI